MTQEVDSGESNSVRYYTVYPGEISLSLIYSCQISGQPQTAKKKQTNLLIISINQCFPPHNSQCWSPAGGLLFLYMSLCSACTKARIAALAPQSVIYVDKETNQLLQLNSSRKLVDRWMSTIHVVLNRHGLCVNVCIQLFTRTPISTSE